MYVGACADKEEENEKEGLEVEERGLGWRLISDQAPKSMNRMNISLTILSANREVKQTKTP